MKSKTKVVVIGGGVVGVSMLYHLAKKGWSDVVLVERKELTSGSTWHAAGLLPLFNMSYSVGQLHKYAVDFYKTLEEETGKNVGFSVVSNIRLASTKDRMDEYHQYAGVAQTIGVDYKFLTPDQVKEIWPLCHTEDLYGAIQHPEDGYIQPADLTQALATGARNRGAEIYRNTSVLGIKRVKDNWIVETDKGSIECEHVVSCTGNFARQTGKMVGLEIPVIPVEHQYIVTEPHPEIIKRKEKGLPEMGVLRDSDSRWYMREEAGGFILGPYEDGAPCCYVDGPSKDSEYELFQEDLERLEPHIEGAYHRVPAFAEVGVKKVYNGAICYTPDGNPIVGPAWGLKNFWINEGHSFGITAACFKINLPTRVDPVIDIFLIISDEISCCAILGGSPDNKFITPLGTPHSLQISTNSITVPGVITSGFTITEHPAAKAVEIFLDDKTRGKFQGVKAATTPTG